MTISADEISAMREIHEEVMMDEGMRKIVSSTIDDSGDEILTFTDGAETVCGVRMDAGEERHMPENTLVTWDAVLRLPVDFDIDEKDRFLITSFRGEEVELLFDVSSPIQKGISANRVKLKRVEY